MDPGWSFEEVNKRPGDFALVGAVTQVTVDGGSVSNVRVVAFGVGSKPMRIATAEQQLMGKSASAVDDARLDKAGTLPCLPTRAVSDISINSALDLKPMRYPGG